MKKQDLFGPLLAVTALLAVVLGCSSLKNMSEQNTTSNTANAANTATAGNTASANSADAPKPTKKGIVSPDDPAEFTFNADDIYKEFKADKGLKVADKYNDKIVAVKGRFKDFDTSKKDTNGGYQARLSVSGEMFAWISCSVDEDFKDDFAKLQKDEMVTFKGLGDRFWLIGPTFKHCVVATQ